jgi:hypothetical protein
VTSSRPERYGKEHEVRTKGVGSGEREMAVILNMVVMTGLIEKGRLEQRLERGEGGSLVGMWVGRSQSEWSWLVCG